jgi:dephospho-CoA kinase
VARFFQDLGAYVIDADSVGHEMIDPGRPAYHEILQHFGRDLLDPSGHIDRKKLGQIVFADSQELSALNAIVHPRIIARTQELAAEHKKQNPEAVVIIDAALLFEARLGGTLNKVVVAWCRPEQQLERLMAKSGVSRDEAERRIQAQMPVEEKRRRADFQIDCSGTLDQSQAQAEAIYWELKRIVEAAHGE